MKKHYIKGHCPVCDSACEIKVNGIKPSFLLCPACFSGELEYIKKIPKIGLITSLAAKLV
jgi:hypothetical protein